MLEIPRNFLKEEMKNISVEKVVEILNSIPCFKIDKTIVEKGKTAEISIENEIKRVGFEFSKKAAHCGDFVIYKKEYPEVRLLVEVKNYSRAVPEKEVEKFFRDLESSNLCGILVSAGKIANKKSIEVSDKYLILCGFEGFAAAAEIFYLKVLAQSKFKFLKTEKKISRLLQKIQDSFDLIAEIKILVFNTNKIFAANRDKIYKICDKIRYETEEEITKLWAESRGEKVEIRENYYPETEIAKAAKPFIEKKLNSYFGSYPLAAVSGNKVEYSNGEKKLLFEFLKTKINIFISFADFKAENLGNFNEISIKNNIVKITLDEKKISSPVLDFI